jgi:hypothetical protein
MSREIIKSIEEVSADDESGYKVVTDKQAVLLMIDNHQSCCENWGYFLSNDNPQEFIGAELLAVNVVDEALNVSQVEALNMHEGSTMFVNLETNKGTLQFTAYNDHNGYYGHKARVESTQLNEETWL